MDSLGVKQPGSEISGPTERSYEHLHWLLSIITHLKMQSQKMWTVHAHTKVWKRRGQYEGA